MTNRPCASTSATATINTTCCKCGSDTGADWAQCLSCGKVYCTACVAERRVARADTLCPCCGSDDLSAAD